MLISIDLNRQVALECDRVLSIVSPLNGLDRDRFLDVGQIRAVSYQQLSNLAGTLETQYWQQI